MAGSFNYRFKDKYKSETCVVKYWFGTKFFIWKALNLKQSCEQVFRDLNRKIIKVDLTEDDLFFNVVKHCKRSRVTMATVEVLFASEDLGAILAFDQEEMIKSCANPDCLNNCKESYIPKWLKNVTPNKAIQPTIIERDDKLIAKESKIKSKPVKKPVVPKQVIETEDVFDPVKIASQIQAIKNAKS